MKISLFIPSLRGGGAERIFVGLATAFAKRGHQVAIVLIVRRGPYLKDVPGEVRIVSLDCPRLWTSLPAFVRYLRRERPEAVLSAMPLANGIAGWGRLFSRISTRLVMSEHNTRSLIFWNIKVPKHYRILYYLCRSAYRLADGIVAVSDGVAKEVRTLPGVRTGRVHGIYNGIDAAAVAAESTLPAEEPWFQQENVTPIVIGMGRLEHQKDFATLLHAFDRVRQRHPARLLILGEGGERPALERLVDELGLRDSVHLPGFVTNPYAYMAKASVFVLSSVHEGLPTVLIEALACGTPVVSTDCPSGPREILDNGRYGTLVPVGDAEALAEAILHTLDDPLPPEILKARAEVFSIDAMADAYLRVLSGENP